ncbi:MAG: L-seryl-tRNA(Sec) selenium transferase [Deltaproteobacteria bacterium]|nr:L-seryl-tRNA(Sec) selenium transferase [Deltaproteobacteria bacterium]
MTTDKQLLFRQIPGVDQLLIHPAVQRALTSHPKALVLKAIHQVLDLLRTDIKEGRISETAGGLDVESVSFRVIKTLTVISRPSLRRVINATGVIVHTNLGRSILPEKVIEKFQSIAGGYSNLEYDLARGQRGSRYVHVEEILKELTGAEAAMVVNNNAGAVLIALETMARGREVVVSRGQLVEIGGSFRIPDVMRKSGARMVEVGTTNKTHLRDYAEVIGPETALLLKVHTSNFQVVGFTSDVPLSELVHLGDRHGVPVMEDLGSGCLIDFSTYGLIKEPTVQEALAQGAGLVTFSGDKLLGGPQAGIILGQRALVEAIRKNPLNRALRIDKLTLLALEEILRLYRDPQRVIENIPTLRMISQGYDSLAAKAERLYALVNSCGSDRFSIELADGASKVGGGALPLQELKSRLLCLIPGTLSSHQMELWLRSYDPPVIARLERDRVMLDIRTIQEGDFKVVVGAIRELSGPGQPEKGA